ncbi:sulfatase [Pseudorhodobacter sp. W20_MBD10_FR17]|uniref:sulfatase family protein n=1 Tax=Pseudorhodobacter sp. W20_MBD10_FR17 TaxID=3240266 RepID=UPI003F964048
MSHRPNILFLCTDQQRWNSLTCYGAIGAHTPNLDRLAAQGARFDNCYVQNPICGPSRASLFTGMYARHHGEWANGVALPQDRKMFTRSLADVGYDCGMVGKQHLAACDSWQTEPRRDDGYRVWEWSHGKNHRSVQNAYHTWLRQHYPEVYTRTFPEKGGNQNTHIAIQSRTGTPIDEVPPECHYTHWVAERAIDFIDTPRDTPFCLVANFFDPHHPFGVPKAYRDKIDASKIPPPIGGIAELDEKPSPHRRYSETSYGSKAVGFQNYSAAEIAEIRAIYYAMIMFIDDEVGRILAALDASGQADNTLVIFTSDHGEMLGDHAQLMKGPMMYDVAVHVPLLMRWPARIPAQSIVPNPVQWVDLSATCLDVAGAAPMDQQQGASLIPLATGTAQGWRDWAICEYRDSGVPEDPPIHTTMLRHADWKLILWHGAPATARDTEGELYHLATDPDELENLYDHPAHKGKRREMKRKLLDVLAETDMRAAQRHHLV